MNLTQYVRNIKNPRDYYCGINSILNGVPRNVLLFHRAQPMNHARAHHHRYVLINCLRGTGAVIIDGTVHLISQDRGIMIFPFQGHEYGLFSPGPISWLYITFEFDDETCLKSLRNVTYDIDKDSRIMLESIAGSFVSATDGNVDAGDAIGFRVGELLSRLVRRATHFASRQQEATSPAQHKAILETICYVHENIARRLPVRDIAIRVSLSPSRLMAVFRAGIGISIGEFILRARMSRACTLLAQSDLNISEVASACGFDSIYSFSRCFRQRQGIPPSAYRVSLSAHRPSSPHPGIRAR
ncbi:MAG: hypothetical protein C0404_08895 [Verrucomicrobia bacterium]|nr:hypothetical protein [Verrucomicrobiota bacterium]